MKKSLILSTLFLLSLCSPVFAASPVLYFSDFTDGPTSGWEGSSTKGAAVTIWGNNFGSTRGSSYVAVSGVALNDDSDYAEWGRVDTPGIGEEPHDVYKSARGLERICFYLNSSMSMGSTTISVTTVDGTSNTIPFYVRALGSNHIYFVSPTGSDSNNGLYATQGSGTNGPWLSGAKVTATVVAGDVVYFREGIYTEIDPAGNSKAIFEFYDNHNNGTANNSISLSSYPNEIAQLGDSSVYGVVERNSSHKNLILNYWTFSKFLMRAYGSVWFGGSGYSEGGPGQDNYVRLVGNDAATYSAEGGENGTVTIKLCGKQDGSHYMKLLGNQLSDCCVNRRGDSVNASTRAYALYVQGYGYFDNLEIGWNEFAYNEKGRVQLYGHSDTDYIDSVYIHDNYIHHHGLHGVILGGGDGSSSYEFMRTCYFYNNIVAFNGQRYPDTDGKGILMGGEGNGGNGGDWYIYNNVFYQNLGGEIHVSSSSNPTSIVVKNNIIVPAPDRSYYSGKSGDFYTGSNNCYYGAGNGPAWDSNRLDNTDPQFVDSSPTTDSDFQLQDSSPAREAGTSDVSAIVTRDYDGNSRPQGSAYDIGAYEYVR